MKKNFDCIKPSRLDVVLCFLWYVIKNLKKYFFINNNENEVDNSIVTDVMWVGHECPEQI